MDNCESFWIELSKVAGWTKTKKFYGKQHFENSSGFCKVVDINNQLVLCCVVDRASFINKKDSIKIECSHSIYSNLLYEMLFLRSEIRTPDVHAKKKKKKP